MSSSRLGNRSMDCSVGNPYLIGVEDLHGGFLVRGRGGETERQEERSNGTVG